MKKITTAFMLGLLSFHLFAAEGGTVVCSSPSPSAKPNSWTGHPMAASDLKAHVQLARCKIDQESAFEEGISMLHEAASQGSDEANFRLGWLYVDGQIVRKNVDHAEGYLKLVKGRFQTSALILLAGLRAQGTSSHPADKSVARKMCLEAIAQLNVEEQKFKQRREGEPMDVDRQQRWYLDWLTLRGIARENDIQLPQ